MPPFPHTVIRASAGTGKTFQLSNRFLGLAAAGESPDHVLATTFARKAAGEILDRVLTRLAEAVEDSAKCAALAQHLGATSLDGDGCAKLLQTLIRRVHRLRIGTLDSFFAQLAGSFGLELGLPPGWRICDELVDQGLRLQAIQEVLRSQETNDVVRLMHLLSKGAVRRSVSEQIFDVVQGLYPLFVESDRAAWHALPHRRELSADELTVAVEALEDFRDLPEDKRFANAHQKDVANARQADWDAFLDAGLAKVVATGAGTYYSKDVGAAIVAAYRPVIDHATAIIVNRVAHQTEASWGLLSRFDEVYRRLKGDRQALRFEDVTRCLSEGLRHLGARDVAFRMDAQIAHLLLDEFQDTSLAQWSVLEGFAREITAAPRDRSFFCVGDVKQAIYGWRGGIAALFDTVTDELPNVSTEPLDVSFRSSPPIIETVNRVFENLSRSDAVQKHAGLAEAWSTRFHRHSTARRELAGYCRMVTAPRVAEGEEQLAETLRFAAGEIAELARRSPGRSIGVLVRRNGVVAELTWLLREKHGVAASEEGGNPLTDSTGVQVVLSAMAMADHPGDTAARFHLSHSPLGPVLGIAEWKDDAAALKASRRIREALLQDGYGRTVYEWVKAITPAYDERELKRLLQLVELAYRYEAQSTVRTTDFIEFVRLTRVEAPSATPVRVMTVHQAKGLQFDIVVLPELEGQLAGQPPTIVAGRDRPTGPITRVCRYAAEDVRSLLPREFRAMFDVALAERANEALCVLYVALTRAVHELRLIVAPSLKNEKAPPGTYAGLLRAALTDGQPTEPEAVLFEHGDPHWHETTSSDAAGERDSAAGAPTDTSDDTIHVRLAPDPVRRGRGLLRQSPSGSEGGGWVSLPRLLRLDASVAMSRGTLIHKWFEQIEWLDDGDPSDAALRAAAEGLVTPGLNLASELGWFRSMLKRTELRRALSRAAYAAGTKSPSQSYRSLFPAESAWPANISRRLAAGEAELVVERERPFVLRDQTSLLQGTMDRVVWCRAGETTLAADIVDFKTDAVDPSDPLSVKGLLALYRPQMDAYRRAVATLTGLGEECVTGRLIFVGSGLVVPV